MVFSLLFCPMAFAVGAKSMPSIEIEEKVLLSKIDERFLEDEEDWEWVMFIKKIGKDKISVMFPNPPVLHVEEGKQVYSAISEGVEYSLIVEEMRGGPLVAEDSDFVDSEGRRVQKRVIVADKIFTLTTISKGEAESKHDFFIASFYRVTPLLD